MKFGLIEIKEFAENHEDERVRIMYRRLCEARSRSAKWCDEVEKLKEENKQLRLGWCKESEKRQGEWQNESVKTPIKIAAIGDTLCHHCNGVGKTKTEIAWDTRGPYSQKWTVCPRCAGKGHL